MEKKHIVQVQKLFWWKYFQDHSLKAVTTCENSLRGEIKRIFNSDGLDWASMVNNFKFCFETFFSEKKIYLEFLLVFFWSDFWTRRLQVTVIKQTNRTKAQNATCTASNTLTLILTSALTITTAKSYKSKESLTLYLFISPVNVCSLARLGRTWRQLAMGKDGSHYHTVISNIYRVTFIFYLYRTRVRSSPGLVSI